MPITLDIYAAQAASAPMMLIIILAGSPPLMTIILILGKGKMLVHLLAQ